MRNKKINIQNLFFSIIYLIFSLIIFYLLYTKKYLNFVTPKSFKYLIFMEIIIVLFFIMELKSIFDITRNINPLSSLSIIIPLLLFIYPDIGIDTEHLNTKYSIENININNKNNTNKIYQGETMTFTISEENAPTLTEANMSNSFFEKKQLTGLDDINKTISISDNEFYDWITTIFANQNKYLGYTITVNGLVFKDNTYMKENQFVPARLLMTCCIADTAPAGLIANYNDTNKLNNGDWVKVTGKLIQGDYNGQKGLIIDVNNISEGNKPEQEYIYPK